MGLFERRPRHDGRSRQILQPTGANVRKDLFRNAVEAAIFGEVSVDLAIPRGLVSLVNKSGQFRELFGRKGVDGVFYFGKAHVAKRRWNRVAKQLYRAVERATFAGKRQSLQRQPPNLTLTV